eukprot:2973209-Alexandrium_andersonii.AAC.1
MRAAWGKVHTVSVTDLWGHAEAFIAEHEDFVFASREFEVEPLTGPPVQQAFNEATASAPGLDGWSNTELKRLPFAIYEALAMLYNAVERGSPWPSAITQARAAFLPKGDEPSTQPLDVRVLTIASSIYRRWAALRLQQVAPWAEKWQLPSMCGSRGQLPANMASWEVALEVEQAMAASDNVTAMTVDIFKAFDQLSRQLIFKLALRAGCPKGVLNA